MLVCGGQINLLQLCVWNQGDAQGVFALWLCFCRRVQTAHTTVIDDDDVSTSTTAAVDSHMLSGDPETPGGRQVKVRLHQVRWWWWWGSRAAAFSLAHRRCRLGRFPSTGDILVVALASAVVWKAMPMLEVCVHRNSPGRKTRRSACRWRHPTSQAR